jgi:fructose-1,6-bisphosphatase/inositol monophosphatase family enzyme
MPLPSRAELEAIARRAGGLALGHFRRVTAERKADRSLVTAADREVEAFLVAELGPLMPEAGIVGEEGATRPGSGVYCIVIDPIDGTAAFVAGLPTWCVCVGILRGATPVAGVVYLPCTDDTYSAVDGTAWWNSHPLPPLTEVDSDQPGDRFILADGGAHRRRQLAYRGKVRSLGSGAHHILLAARGAAEAALLGQAHVWDLVAPGAVLEAVGGRYEYLGGEPVDLGTLLDGRPLPGELLAGAPATLARLRPLLGRA